MLTKGDEPHHLQLNDATGHAGTVLNGLLANAWFIELFNSEYGTNIAPLSDNEILVNAGILRINSNDFDPPNPDPMIWATAPNATGTTSISMTATAASDPSGVEYYFDETSGNSGGSDSDWQDSATYEDTSLVPETQYTYQVKARDKSANNNETDWSSEFFATTDAEAPAPKSGCGAAPMYRDGGQIRVSATASSGKALLPLLPSIMALGLWSLYRAGTRRKNQIMSGSKD